MQLFTPRIPAPQDTAARPSDDRFPDQFAAGTPASLKADLEALLGADQVFSRALDLVRYATDFSAYRLMPKVVVNPQTAGEVAAVLRYARERGHTVTFRAAGTSVNGQAQGDDILVDVRRGWTGATAQDSGSLLRVRPGTTVARANAAVARYGKRLGPDPASSASCTVGGTIANNSSGFAAGVSQTAAVTLRSATVVLASGTIIDTGAPDADQRLAEAEPELVEGLLGIKAEIEADTELAQRIRHKYAIKNTNGYRLDAFLIGNTAAEILTRLMVCSQGTLGFVAEAVFETVPLLPRRAAAWLMFASLADAAAMVPRFMGAGATVAEVLDGHTLRTIAAHGIGDAAWVELPDDAATLLVEVRAGDESALSEALPAVEAVLADCVLWQPGQFTRDKAEIRRFWEIREGLGGLAGLERPDGHTMIVEDVCVPPDRIAEGIADLSNLLRTHGFDRSVQGHASAGNLHFSLMVDFGTEEGRARYGALLDDLAELIIGTYDGSLKAEHATGRNMAPFLPTEWGTKATDLMWRIKALFDPDGILAPDVVLSRDPKLHLKNLQSMPTVEAVVDHCIECGFCEHICPSRDLTSTPRQRIVVRREIARQGGDTAMRRALLDQYDYDAVQTCAGDGSCSIACPVDIDTGALMKAYRRAEHSPRAEGVALLLARRWAIVERMARAALWAGHLAGDRAMTTMTGLLRKVVSDESMPGWLSQMPYPAKSQLPHTDRDVAVAVYFPACINRIFGRDRARRHELSLPEALVAISARAGKPVWIPGDAAGNCCATVWHSKGYRDGNTYMANRIVEKLWAWTDLGKLPVIIDAASCTLGILDEVTDLLTADNRHRRDTMTIMDATTWCHQHLLPHLSVPDKLGTAAVHPTCSTRRLGVENALAEIGAALAHQVTVPEAATCCAFAGDRGLLHPELTASATAEEAAELTGTHFDTYLCNNRTCEIGLDRATGSAYESFVYTLEILTRQPVAYTDGGGREA